ncbi:C4-dicarboxylate-binding periplasmic protein DctP [subsurface metagenome]
MHKMWTNAAGPYGLGNTIRPLRTPDDFKDWKFRVSGAVGFVSAMQNMGEGTGMTFETLPSADIYNALQTGVIDGCWSPWSLLIEYRYMEVMPYFTVLDFGWDVNDVVINKPLWDGLPQDLKDAIFKAAMVAEERDYEAHRRAQDDFARMAAEAGVEIYYPTPEEKALFREKANMPAVWEELVTPWLDEHFPNQNMTQKILNAIEQAR